MSLLNLLPLVIFFHGLPTSPSCRKFDFLFCVLSICKDAVILFKISESVAAWEGGPSPHHRWMYPVAGLWLNQDGWDLVVTFQPIHLAWPCMVKANSWQGVAAGGCLNTLNKTGKSVDMSGGWTEFPCKGGEARHTDLK